MADFSYKLPKIVLFDIKLAFDTPKIQLFELQNPSNIPWGTIPMAYSMKMGHKWVVEAQIGL